MAQCEGASLKILSFYPPVNSKFHNLAVWWIFLKPLTFIHKDKSSLYQIINT